MATTLLSPIKIAYPPGTGDLEVRIQAGACRLHISPAGEQATDWITGRYQDPSRSIAVDATVDGNRASISVGRSPADIFGLISGVPELWLEIGAARPFALTVAAGASENQLDLGGLPLRRLEVNHGAGSMDVTFSTPVQGRTSSMKFAVGAGKTVVTRLGNVNFEELAVEGGAASCVLDFSGTGLTSGRVRVSTAMASIEARIPAALSTEITSEHLLGHPQADAGFTRQGNTWLNPAAAKGTPIQLRIRSALVMGQLRLQSIS
jgi:hypothetical protein